MKAKYIDRFSVVKYRGELFSIENRPRKPLLIRANGTGIELKSGQVELEVIKYPAQLASDYLDKKATE